MHHTGIKTRGDQQLSARLDHFNCTIQELKLDEGNLPIAIPSNFNCTIQELKRTKPTHTGIRMTYFNCTIQELKPEKKALVISSRSFQLHHTGIKTHEVGEILLRDLTHFNCTIQELKRLLHLHRLSADGLFQLHHTGIKTNNIFKSFKGLAEISIAPYRN